MLLDRYIDYNLNELRHQYQAIIQGNAKKHYVWDKYGGTYRYDLSEFPYGPCQELFKRLDEKYDLPEKNRSPAIWVFPGSTELPIHRDPDSYAWIAVVLEGDQSLGFYNEDKHLMNISNYKIALTNSKTPHKPVSDGKERVLLRKVYLETPYEELVKCFS